MADASLPRSAAGDRNPWLIAVVVSLATFMEVLDTTIANVSLRHIAGSLGASQDESTWILTSYLISNAIVLPISGWLSQLIGRKRFYMICVGLFTISSFLCAFAPNLGLMILFRVFQGLGGGGLAPTEQSIFADSFTPAKRSVAFALYGVTVVVAPAIGPLLGGWLTDDYSWHWIFLINLPVGLLALTLIWFLVDEPKAVVEDTRKFRANFIPDWLGFLLVAMTFGSLQIVLDRFQQDDGFASLRVTLFFATTIFSAVALVWWELRHPQPVFDVRLFGYRSFAIACLLMFLLGFTLFSTTQLLPQFAQTLLNYSALQAGEALAWGGAVAVLVMPIAGVIGRKIPAKWILMAAFVATGLAFLHTAHLDLQIQFSDLSMARVYQSAALPFLFVTLTTAGYVGIPPEKNSEASAIINLMRNLGGSVGVSIATTALAWRTQFHHVRLADHVSRFDVGPGSFADVGLAAAQSQVQTQAQALSYFDVFWLFGIAAIAVVPLALLLKKPPKGAPAGGH
jgi:DHA2 family multidrug resistance protein